MAESTANLVSLRLSCYCDEGRAGSRPQIRTAMAEEQIVGCKSSARARRGGESLKICSVGNPAEWIVLDIWVGWQRC